MELCSICDIPLTGTRHTVEMSPGVRQVICHSCHVEITSKITGMTIEKATPLEVNGL